MTDGLLLTILIVLVLRAFQEEHQHRELIETINALAEMIGENLIDTRKE